MSATIQDLKTQIGQLPNILVGSDNLPSQSIPNPRGNVSVVSLRSALEQRLRLIDADFEPDANLQVPQLGQTLLARKPESDEELLKMFRKVEINFLLLDAIKQIPKYAKFLKELCVHKRRKMK
ncbi:hypothetical protein CR513_20111, partial [Mucuna pruriens]